MNILSAIAVLLTAGALAAQSPTKPQPSPLACNRAAIAEPDRPRYRQLADRLRAAVRGVAEQPGGYSLRLDDSRMTLAEAAEWMSLERRCCPFLTLRLETSGAAGGASTLTLTGPPGAKEILAAAFGLK